MPAPILMTHNGRTQSIRAWALETGIKELTLWYRLKAGYPLAEALSRPVMLHRQTTERRRAYHSYRAMLGRCTNPEATGYDNYGGKGITICQEWLESFETFYRDMGGRSVGMTLERRDNQGNYCPKNCYWASRAAQARNRRTTQLLTYRGKTMCELDWCRRLGLKKGVIRARLQRGWTLARALTTRSLHLPN